ncbi:MAG: response regulator [Bryobacterales bacterium]|nr:response regulator [Bryobacterales bacterium]
MTCTHSESLALVVDDNEVFRSRLCRALQDRGWRAAAAADGPAAIEFCRQSAPDLAIVDLRLPGMGGLDIVQEILQIDETICVIVLTGYGSIATAIAATRLGAAHYLSKPADADDILAAYRSHDNGEPSPIGDDTPTSVPSLARVEWEHIQRVLADCDGNISQAAKLLGLHRRSLQRKLAKYPPHT